MYKKTTLSNGLRVITAEMPYTRSAAVQFYLKVGARHERSDLSGVSHFVEHMVFKGTNKRPNPVQISEAIEGVGGSLDAATDHEHTNYRALVPSAYMPAALDVLTDLLRNPRFELDDVEKERAVIMEEISSTYDNPSEIVDLVFDEMLWDGHPLGRDVAGSRQSVKRIKRRHLVEHVGQHYRPDTTVVSVAGNVTHDNVVSEIESLWSDLRPSEARDVALNPPAPVTESIGPRVMSFKKRTEQTNLVVGVPSLPYTHPDRFTQDVLDALLGSGMSSRLFVELRENRGLAYSVSSFTKTYADVGAFGVHAAVDNDAVTAALEAIIGEFRKLRETPVGETELRKVKEYIKGHTLLSLERSGYVAHWAGWQELMLNRIDSVDEVLDRIEAVTAHDLMLLARRLFSTELLHLAVVGPVKDEGVYKAVLQIN